MVTLAEHDPGDAGPPLPQGEGHEAVEDDGEPEAERPPAPGPAELPGQCKQADRERRPAEDQADAAGQKPRGLVVDRAEPQISGRVGDSTKRAAMTANQVQPIERTTYRTTVLSAGTVRLTMRL